MSKQAQSALIRQLQRAGTRAISSSSRRVVVGARQKSTVRKAAVALNSAATSSKYRRASSVAAVVTQDDVKGAPSAVQAQTPLEQALQDTCDLLETEIGGDGVWTERVQAALRDLHTPRRARMGVYGDDLAAPQDVVSALLLDPLAEDADAREAVKERHVGFEGDQFEIHFGRNPSRARDSLTLPAPWLQNTGFDLVEVMPKENSPIPLSNLLRTDVPLLILDPIRLLQAPSLAPVLPFLLAHPHLQIIINGAIPSSSSLTATKERLHQQLAQLVPGYSSEKGSIGVGFVRADKALSAIDALGRGIGLDTGIVEDRSDAIQTFQHDFTASNFGPLQAHLSAYLSGVAPVTDLTSPPANFQVETAKTTLGVALTYISNVVLSSSRAARAVLSSASDLRTEAHRRAEHARQNSVVSLGISSGIVQGSVEQELAQSEREVRALMGQRLGWSKLVLGAVDDVGEEVAAEVQKCFGRGLEERLVFEAGELALLHRDLSQRADDCLAELSPFRKRSQPASASQPYPFHSPLLLNHLQTLALTTSQPSPATLTAPLHHRRDQLLIHSVPKLHKKAQQAVLQTYSFSAASAACSWVAAVPGDLMDWYPAVGVASLGILASIRWGQERWLKAQNAFWADWHRVGGMLKQDLETRYRDSLNTQVLVKPLAAADGLEILVKKRIARLDSIEHRRAELQRRIKASVN